MYKQINFLLIWGLIVITVSLKAQNPLDLAKLVADRVIENTGFGLDYELQQKNSGLEVIDFGRTYGFNLPAIAYAKSKLFSKYEQTITIDVAHFGGTKIWVNGHVVYESNSQDLGKLEFSDTGFKYPASFTVTLKEGSNDFLVKSSYRNGDWNIHLASKSFAQKQGFESQVYFSLNDIAPKIGIANWLIIGPFPSVEEDDLAVIFPPEYEFVIGRIYHYGKIPITWTIPHIEIVADRSERGQMNTDLSYYAGGLMWAMQELAKYSKDTKYMHFAEEYVALTSSCFDLVNFQVDNLHAYNSTFSRMKTLPMMDWQSAPAFPFIQFLIDHKNIGISDKMESLVDTMKNYLVNKQVRIHNGILTRTTPEKYTFWADDMFVGGAMLLLLAQETDDVLERKELFDDAANQIVGLNKYLFDNELKLYHQGYFTNSPEILIPYWSRANGWAIWAVVEALERLPSSHPQWNSILKIYRNHIDGLVKVQNDATGFWPNVLNHPDSFLETSGTAMFTLALARGIRHGWINETKYLPYALKGWQAIRSAVDANGTLYKTVGGTNISIRLEDYLNAKTVVDDPHGTFPVIFTAIELSKLDKAFPEKNLFNETTN